MDYQTLGLTSLQADVVAALLEAGGEAPAPTIIEILSRSQRVNRTSIYSVLNKLEQRGIVGSKDEHTSNYTLISTKPDQLVDHLLGQQQQEITDFTAQLNQAKSRQKSRNEPDIFSFRSKQQVRERLEVALKHPDNYLLIMANGPILDLIQPLIARLDHEQRKHILVVPTWSPDPTRSIGELTDGLRQVLPPDNVADPLPIFERVRPMMMAHLEHLPDELIEPNPGNAFVMVLNPEEWMLASYLLGEVPLISGIYSREPIISQMLHILYLTIFENLSGLDHDQINRIMEIKTQDTMQFFSKLFRDR